MKNFEQRLQRLEYLADRIKEPDLPIEEAMKVFEEGMTLSKGLRKELESLQGKVEMITNGPDDQGGPDMVPFQEVKE
ncbi:MAG: exodeoxyribonuclease VII small subunit [Spirochaetaceae bacterium]|nr:exodeoxyribonuclease VII small subunit [Spirochaetaceae bacterium]